MRFERLVLVMGLLAWAGGCAGEYIAPLKSVGDGVPADLPALGKDDFASVRLIVNG